ncbi:hypothetical protein EYF80_055916 [Liparis tanakae]|uniref:Uncharacterized protein n=1 Tax=Liparis tanakae TaxID=230148 RepID=A0A4Z2EY82_9TELE|nr:hypothetical protein EYF80_055916 [Liparis tanakae]
MRNGATSRREDPRQKSCIVGNEMFRIPEPDVLEAAATALRWRRTRRLIGESPRVTGKESAFRHLDKHTDRERICT